LVNEVLTRAHEMSCTGDVEHTRMLFTNLAQFYCKPRNIMISGAVGSRFVDVYCMGTFEPVAGFDQIATIHFTNITAKPDQNGYPVFMLTDKSSFTVKFLTEK
jgi:hypothetical protein